MTTETSAQRNVPYGAIEGWRLPVRAGSTPALSQPAPWNACTAVTAASRDVSTAVPRPVRSRSASAVITPNAPNMPASRSAIGSPTRVGSPPGTPSAS